MWADGAKACGSHSWFLIYLGEDHISGSLPRTVFCGGIVMGVFDTELCDHILGGNCATRFWVVIVSFSLTNC